MSVILTIGLCIVLGVFGLFIYDLRRAIIELKYINIHETNALITMNTNFPVLNKLIQETNESLKRNREIEQISIQKDKQIRQMLTNLTHDIKTPLTVAMGYVQLINKTADIKLGESLNKVSKNLNSVNYYLHYLMDFNMIQEKGVSLDVVELDVSKVLENELFGYFDEFENCNLQVELEIASNVVIKTDQAMLLRVFQNLIGNVLKYARNQVTVQLKLIDQEHVMITFENQLKAPVEHAELLLNRFYTGDESRTNQSSGIGLSIVQSLVTTLGGRFDVEVTDDTFKAIVVFKK